MIAEEIAREGGTVGAGRCFLSERKEDSLGMVRAPDSPARRRRKGEMVPRFLRGRDRGEHGWQGAFKRLLQPFSRFLIAFQRRARDSPRTHAIRKIAPTE